MNELLYRGHKIKWRRIDVKFGNRWEYIIDKNVAGRAKGPGGCMLRAKEKIDTLENCITD